MPIHRDQAQDKRKVWEALKEFRAHQAWEELATLVLQDQRDHQGRVIKLSHLGNLQAKLERALKDNDFYNAKYYQGRMDQLREDYTGELITQLLDELVR